MSKNNSDFKKTLWKAAEKLRNQIDAAEYKHIVLGLIFVKYISDSFLEQREKIKEMVTNPSSDYFISENINDITDNDLEDRDYYTKDNIFWVPESSRWETLRSQAKQPDVGAIIDRIMGDIESENKSLKGKLDKRFGRTQLEPGKLGELIDLISTIGFSDKQKAGDVLGEVYEYFLGEFALAEGKNGGQFYTTKSIVKTLVAILAPYKGRVYDPCCGSGGMFVQSEEFIKSHGGRIDDISIYGQESNPTTWRLAAMNLAIRGFAADLGKVPTDTFGRDQHPDMKFDYILMNPHFNDKDWGGEKYENDPRWVYGRPSVGNANYAWLQHVLWKLAPGGQAGVVLANGSMTSKDQGEGNVREAIIKDDLVEVMVALPGQLFLNTPIPACLWFLTKDKTKNGRNRKNETLFIDARNLGTMVTRVNKVFTDEDIKKIQDTVSSWRTGDGYEDIKGFCYSASLDDIKTKRYALTPGLFVRAEDELDDDLPFEERFELLKVRLEEEFKKGEHLQSKILKIINEIKL